MSERVTTIIVVFMGVAALVLVAGITYAAVEGKPIDALAGTITGTITDGLLALLKSGGQTPAAQVPPPAPKPEEPAA